MSLWKNRKNEFFSRALSLQNERTTPDWCVGFQSVRTMWSRDMPREERIRSSRTPSTMASSTTSSSHNFHHHSSSNNSSPMTTREDDDGASGSPDFGKAARSSSHHHHGKVDFGGTLVVDERTPLSSLKENNNSNTNYNYSTTATNTIRKINKANNEC